MFYYKDLTGAVSALDDRSFEYLLPPGSESITEEEAFQIIQAVDGRAKVN